MDLPARLAWVAALSVFPIVGCVEVTDEGDTAPLTMTMSAGSAIGGGSETPLEGVELCETDTANCVTTDANGDATLRLPVGREVSFTVEREGYASYLIAYVSQPEGYEGRLGMYPNDRMALLHEHVGSPYPMRGTGSILLFVTPGRRGATFDLMGATGKAYYEDDEYDWSLTLTATTRRGAGGFVEVSPGDFQLNVAGTAERCVPLRWGWPGEDEDSIRFPVRDGYLSRANVYCAISPEEAE